MYFHRLPSSSHSLVQFPAGSHFPHNFNGPGKRSQLSKIVLSLPFLTHAPLSPPLFLPHFLCATLRWARSSSTTNTASLIPAEKERHWNMREWKVGGRREEGGGVSVEKLSSAVMSWLLTCGKPEIGLNRRGIDRRKCCKPAKRDQVES